MRRQRLRKDHQSTPPRFKSVMTLAGFESIDIDTKRVFWKDLQNHGAHVIVETLGDPIRFPDWETRFAEISVYRGPYVCEILLHREIAYTLEDLEAFIDHIKEGAFQ